MFSHPSPGSETVDSRDKGRCRCLIKHSNRVSHLTLNVWPSPPLTTSSLSGLCHRPHPHASSRRPPVHGREHPPTPPTYGTIRSCTAFSDVLEWGCTGSPQVGAHRLVCH